MVIRIMALNCPEYVEVDPSGRYGRYNEVLGKGSSKTVYRAFDEYEGIEVAWNQVKLNDFLQSPEDLERLYCEIHLLKTLKHRSIMKFYTSWVDISKRNINFVTEMFTSGTLRQYRQKHKRVNMRAVKHWCRQILGGLLYLHSHDPPVIHRDLKCDNIFINGNQGEVKIGDLGLAAILRKSHAVHCVGTPEFMAPEVYEEEYNELVDIYSFGMCLLEMVTFEYPYSECTHPAQIYKKVISGTKPEALCRVKDTEVRQFIEKCLVSASRRLSARELLNDSFLQVEGHGLSYGNVAIGEITPILRRPSFNQFQSNGSLISNGFFREIQCDMALEEDGWEYEVDGAIETHGIDLFNSQEDEPFGNVDITIKGRRKVDGDIFIRLRIADKEGKIRNIYFPFDIEADTALNVAMEMVEELDITDHDVSRIAEMIDGELSALVPEWRPGPGIEEASGLPCATLCQNCASNGSSCGSLLRYHSFKTEGCGNPESVNCSHLECAAMHGRFEEITFKVEGSDSISSCSLASSKSRSDKMCAQFNHLAKDEGLIHMNGGEFGVHFNSNLHECLGEPESDYRDPTHDTCDDDENEVCQELRWLQEKYQMELREHRNQQLGGSRTVFTPSPDINKNKNQSKSFYPGRLFSFQIPHISPVLSHRSSHNEINGHCTSSPARKDGSPEFMFTAKSFYAGTFLPNSLLRTKSLPVNTVGI